MLSNGTTFFMNEDASMSKDKEPYKLGEKDHHQVNLKSLALVVAVQEKKELLQKEGDYHQHRNRDKATLK